METTIINYLKKRGLNETGELRITNILIILKLILAPFLIIGFAGGILSIYLILSIIF